MVEVRGCRRVRAVFAPRRRRGGARALHGAANELVGGDVRPDGIGLDWVLLLVAEERRDEMDGHMWHARVWASHDISPDAAALLYDVQLHNGVEAGVEPAGRWRWREMLRRLGMKLIRAAKARACCEARRPSDGEGLITFHPKSETLNRLRCILLLLLTLRGHVYSTFEVRSHSQHFRFARIAIPVTCKAVPTFV